MFHSPIPTAVTEGKGTISLCARIYILGNCHEAHIIEASAETRTACVRVPGRFDAIVSFHNIANVALKYADGTIIESFGTPRTSNPASLAFIQYASAS